MPWTVRFLTGSRSTGFAQVNRHVELSVGDRDCPLLSAGACPRCAPDGALVAALAPPVVEGHGRRGRTRYGPCSDGLQPDRRVGPSLVRPASSATLRRRGAGSRPARLTNTCSWLYCLQCKGRPGLTSPDRGHQRGGTADWLSFLPMHREAQRQLHSRKRSFRTSSGTRVSARRPCSPTRGGWTALLGSGVGPNEDPEPRRPGS
jgi:hypothetical protein